MPARRDKYGGLLSLEHQKYSQVQVENPAYEDAEQFPPKHADGFPNMMYELAEAELDAPLRIGSNITSEKRVLRRPRWRRLVVIGILLGIFLIATLIGTLVHFTSSDNNNSNQIGLVKMTGVSSAPLTTPTAAPALATDSTPTAAPALATDSTPTAAPALATPTAAPALATDSTPTLATPSKHPEGRRPTPPTPSPGMSVTPKSRSELKPRKYSESRIATPPISSAAPSLTPKAHSECAGDESLFFCPGGVLTHPYRGSHCIDKSELCDGYQDCVGNEDEKGCHYECDEHSFRCVSGIDVTQSSPCIFKEERCDTIIDCEDGSDESNCTCNQQSEFRCERGHSILDSHFCIAKSRRCDGSVDCSDESDEYGCGDECSNGAFRCGHRRNRGNGSGPQDTDLSFVESPLGGVSMCIKRRLVCNGVDNCGDASDEWGCHACADDHYFTCNNEHGLECIDKKFVCDRQKDCNNGRDEFNCTYPCDEGRFACVSGVISRYPHHGYCIYDNERCNGYEDCADGSDEQLCPSSTCDRDKIKCLGGDDVADGDYCIQKEAVCDRVQDCPDSADERNCTYRCPSGTFMCRTGTRIHGLSHAGARGFCVDLSARCDGVRHCGDGSDEEGCQATTCPLHHFRCENGHDALGNDCIHESYVCDRTADCSDGSDESSACNFTCAAGHVPCRAGLVLRSPYTGFCIRQEEVCNGFKDCADGSDETNCTSITCSDGRFRCSNGTDVHFGLLCIHLKYRCNGHIDCADGSDEHGCNKGCIDDNCTESCLKTQFKCWTGTRIDATRGEKWEHCVNKTRVCDSYHDCVDGSDEAECSYHCSSRGMFNCSSDSPACVSTQLTCDGTNDCRDGSDESANLCAVCALHEFKCDNVTSGRACVDESFLCDREHDCLDGSDEWNCTFKCPARMTACASGTTIRRAPHLFCIYDDNVCDGVIDCEDLSDERDCPCHPHEFSCHNRTSSLTGCVPAEYVCDRRADCADKSDEEACNYTCARDMFTCTSLTAKNWLHRGYCVPLHFKCDGSEQCIDRSDEENCTSNTNQCSSLEYQCANGTDYTGRGCVRMEYRCDRDADCTDGSDEHNCEYTCSTGETKCTAGTIQNSNFGFCIKDDDVCDGFDDCKDGSDEKDCDVINCHSSQFKCTNGTTTSGTQCLAQSYRCDRKQDCSDASDERNCTYTCLKDEFTCTTGTVTRTPNRGFCILSARRCDGFIDCIDASDEHDCASCPNEGFRCASGRLAHSPYLVCAAAQDRCDGHVDCEDHSDEANCTRRNCPFGEVACAISTVFYTRGYCLHPSDICDGFVDCEDHSDELFCNGTLVCATDHFKCGHLNSTLGFACVPPSFICNNKTNCRNGADEAGCHIECPDAAHIPCTGGGHSLRDVTSRCIPIHKRCDHITDCSDGSDEDKC